MKICSNCKRSYFNDTKTCSFDGFRLDNFEDPMIGALIDNKYVIEDVVGQGASSNVYKATRLLMPQELALKILNYTVDTTSYTLQKFFREIDTTTKLKHPNIINVMDCGITDENKPYMVMEYLEGYTLARVLNDNKNLSLNRIMEIINQICLGLQLAHDSFIIHKDIKPANIMLSSQSTNVDFIKIVDFGIAELTQKNGTKSTKIVGSPAYMSPEQIYGLELDPRTDIYSLGVLTFELLTGKRPFITNDINSLLTMHLNSKPPDLWDVNYNLKNYHKLNDVIQKVLSKNKIQRQSSVMEFFEDFESSLKFSINAMANNIELEENLKNNFDSKIYDKNTSTQLLELEQMRRGQREDVITLSNTMQNKILKAKVENKITKGDLESIDLDSLKNFNPTTNAINNLRDVIKNNDKSKVEILIKQNEEKENIVSKPQYKISSRYYILIAFFVFILILSKCAFNLF